MATLVTCDNCKEPDQEVGQGCFECGEIMLAPRTCDVCNEPDQEVGQPCVQCGEILDRQYIPQDDLPERANCTNQAEMMDRGRVPYKYCAGDIPFSEMVTTDGNE